VIGNGLQVYGQLVAPNIINVYRSLQQGIVVYSSKALNYILFYGIIKIYMCLVCRCAIKMYSSKALNFYEMGANSLCSGLVPSQNLPS
jgi:nitric oxide reductase large subunit